MTHLKPGDRINCRVKESIIVGPYREHDEVLTFDIVAVDSIGYYLYVPSYVTVKGASIFDAARCKRLGINPRFVNQKILYITDNLVYQVKSVMDGMCCSKCQDFFLMAAPNQEDGTMICYGCRANPYR